MQSIEQQIRNFIADNILFSSYGYPYPDDASFLEKGVIDSMNVMEITMFLEENFKIHIDDSDITPDHFDSISKLAALVRQKLRVSV